MVTFCLPVNIMSGILFVCVLVCVLACAIKDRNLGFFWQITDINYDRNYDSKKGDARKDCHVSSSRGRSPPGQRGNSRCDSPGQLITSLVSAIRENDGHLADFILWTGGTHCNCENSTLEDVFNAVTFVARELLANLPTVPVFPCLGYTDYVPAGHLPAYDIHGSYYGTLAEQYGPWVGSQDTFLRSGYYAAPLSDAPLTLLLLNTVLFCEGHVASSATNPGRQWTWLEHELITCQRQGRKAYLVMSVPPGSVEDAAKVPGRHWFASRHNKLYLMMVYRYRHVIAGQFAGHVHRDTFRLLKRGTGEAYSALFLSPAVGPRTRDPVTSRLSSNNPGVRLYMYDKDTLQVLDYTQLMCNLSSTSGIIWEPAYTFSSLYAVPDLSLGSLHRLALRLRTRPGTWRRYVSAYSVFLSEGDCNGTCVQRHVCAITNVDYSEYLECLASARPRVR